MYKRMVAELKSELEPIQSVSQDEIFSYFIQYVENAEELKKMISFGLFRFEYQRVKLYFKDTIFEEGICKIVQTFHTAMREHLEECKPHLKEFAINIAKGSANISRMRFLNTERRPQRLDLFAKEVLRDIAEMIENTIQPYMNMFYQLLRIMDGKGYNQKCKLGNTVRELAKDELFRSLYYDLTIGENIARWRNAYEHGDYKTEEDEIVVQFEDKKVVTNRDELQKVLIVVDWLLAMHKTAYMLFTVDYWDFIKVQDISEMTDTDSLQDMIVMHIAEASSMYNCWLDSYSEENHIIVISMQRLDIPRDEITKLLNIITMITRDTYKIILCYEGKVYYATNPVGDGYECTVFGQHGEHDGN